MVMDSLNLNRLQNSVLGKLKNMDSQNHNLQAYEDES